MFIKLYSRTKRFFRASDGSSAVEYGLLVSLISLALILSVGLLGTTLSGNYEKTADAMNGISSANSGNSNEIGNIGNNSGNDGSVPGQGGTPPDQGGTPPGQGGTPPGQGGTPPGHGGTPPGRR